MIDLTQTRFTDDKGKYGAALYELDVPDDLSQTEIHAAAVKMWPRAYGKSKLVLPPTTAHGRAKMIAMDVNRKQTTRKDWLARLKKAFGENVSVQVIGSLPGVGSHDHKGTSRKGTKRLVKNAPIVKVVNSH